MPLIPKETFTRLSEIKADNPKREEDTIAVLQTLARSQTATLEIILQLCKYVAFVTRNLFEKILDSPNTILQTSHDAQQYQQDGLQQIGSRNGPCTDALRHRC